MTLIGPSASSARGLQAMSIGDPVASAAHENVLARVADPGITLAIWRRNLDAALQRAARALSTRMVGVIAAIDPCKRDEQQSFTAALKRQAGDNCALVVDDVVNLAKRFSQMNAEQMARIRFESVDDDACRLFHLDNVAMRLVVTYYGPGTQWVSPAFAADARARQTGYVGPVEQLQSGDVAIFKGKKGAGSNLIYHRSPPLKSGDAPRLVAVIDTVEDHRAQPSPIAGPLPALDGATRFAR